jgi:LacI family transcriptional regulator
MGEKITIRDVAKHAGVSAASVSYVLNGINKVSDETKERIF